jgi:hypothetical protein
VIPVLVSHPHPSRPLVHHLSRDHLAVLAAFAAPLAAAAILLPWRSSWANTNVALLLVVVVVAVAAIGNRWAAAIAAVWAALWFDFFYTVPYDRFVIRGSADLTTFVLLLLVGLAVSQLASRARQLRVLAVTDARYLAQIHATAALAQSATTPDVVVTRVRAQLTDLLGLQECRFEYGALIGHPLRLEQDGAVRGGYGPLVAERRGLPGEEIELRATAHGQFYGRFMMTPRPGARPSRQARLTAVTLADLAGQSLGARQPT